MGRELRGGGGGGAATRRPPLSHAQVLRGPRTISPGRSSRGCACQRSYTDRYWWAVDVMVKRQLLRCPRRLRLRLVIVVVFVVVLVAQFSSNSRRPAASGARPDRTGRPAQPGSTLGGHARVPQRNTVLRTLRTMVHVQPNPPTKRSPNIERGTPSRAHEGTPPPHGCGGSPRKTAAPLGLAAAPAAHQLPGW